MALVALAPMGVCTGQGELGAVTARTEMERVSFELSVRCFDTRGGMPITRDVVVTLKSRDILTLKGREVLLAVEKCTVDEKDKLLARLVVSARPGTPRDIVVGCVSRFRFGFSDQGSSFCYVLVVEQ